MPVIKYKDSQTGNWVALGSGVLGTEIPFSENTPENDNAWIDPVSESLKYKDPGTGVVKKVGVSENEVYSKEEVNTFLQKKIEFTLLWENTSPTSTFVAQTIDLDLSTYNSVFVQAKHENGPNNWVSPVITPVGSGGSFNAFAASGAYDTYRFFSTSASNVNFGDASYWSETDNASYKDNRFLIPMRIYGVKGI